MPSRASILAMASCKRLHRLHVEHRIVDAFGDSAKVVAFFIAVGGFADKTRGDEFNFLGYETDLGVGLTFFLRL
jgi:hypothetical protein